MFYGLSHMLQFSEFVWALSYSGWDVFNNFLLIDATDRSKIISDQKRVFIALSLYPLSFFENSSFKGCWYHGTISDLTSFPPPISHKVSIFCPYVMIPLNLSKLVDQLKINILHKSLVILLKMMSWLVTYKSRLLL